ncbi:DUF402 domain-containing protein [Halohasta litorea]|uniref:Probable ribonuclease FAU-1 n=1 Tax=Halohasta litorea TaxID=869891 RepID=A0ABD6DB07_9EURY|nr:DUF402 domain-containing protein [Halohasta litorea]
MTDTNPTDDTPTATNAAADTHRARIRGIYTTALTQRCLTAGWQVVDASGPIERRFETSFETGPADVAIETTDDRQGVGLQGTPAAVDAATDLVGSVGIDTLGWADPAPEGAVFDGRVAETSGRGAVVDLGDCEGYLPFRGVDGHLDSGDSVRVQVQEAAPPWDDDRPLLSTTIEVSDGLVTLIPEAGEPTVDTRDEAAARELVGMTELLGVEAPDGWRIRWAHAATEAGMATLETVLDRTADRAAALTSKLDADDVSGGVDAAGDAPAELAAPAAGAWLWFGRESRFALDEIRRDVTTTMPGHHRIKAGSNGASAGVDFVEALCSPSGEFPFETVADTFGPAVGDEVEIAHGKPAGHCISLGSGTVIERDSESLTLRRELSGGGTYDGLGVPRQAGDTATTTVREGRWWYPTVYRDSEGSVKGTYVNVCTPVECFPGAVRYVDLHVDVLKHADGRIERVDDDELDAAVEDGDVDESLAEKARSVASALENAF